LTPDNLSTSRLRKAAIKARRALNDEARDNASAKICDLIIHSHEFMSCKILACYLPTDDEVDPTAVINRAWRAKKRVFAPVTSSHGKMFFRQLTPDTDLAMNQFGLWEPLSGPSIAAKFLDVVITPLAAFDAERHRIGMGGGYFDRCFHFLQKRKTWLQPKLIGVAFDCQKVEKIVPNPWDVRLYRIVTESN
jgi:5-formyltetrahydrofolate cyclo-ligase